ncbi:fluoride efflux transporter CrcB [Gordonia sp. LSe1-13]|uniref:Fluoride-specific ion channel FluC n=1 Tax=Gordonia sesuvii TaxID=3116777 RepID=A0ABU7MIE4_9ACTN|nr:fluoride efflux transporter CrcB [Gordonia sp. LSe1-13]
MGAEDPPDATSRADSHRELPTDPDVLRPLHLRPSAIAWVLIGGACGTGLRYWVEELLPHEDTAWPWGTFLVNLIGAFALGALLEGLARSGEDAGPRRRNRLLLGTGLCGSFTTYSSFALEMSLLTHRDALPVAIGYGLASVCAGALCAWLGIVTAQAAVPRRPEATT